MNEPKRRGRPPKAVLLSGQGIEGGDVAPVQSAPNGWTVTELKVDGPVVPETVFLNPETHSLLDSAQAYAMRVWSGQSSDVGRAVRIARCKAAVEGQNLPTDALKFPGADRDDDEWTAEDMRPVTWRKAQA